MVASRQMNVSDVDLGTVTETIGTITGSTIVLRLFACIWQSETHQRKKRRDTHKYGYNSAKQIRRRAEGEARLPKISKRSARRRGRHSRLRVLPVHGAVCEVERLKHEG
jgi:hypothetical protein